MNCESNRALGPWEAVGEEALPSRASLWRTRPRCSVAGKLSPLPSSTSNVPWSVTCRVETHAHT